MVSPSHPSEGQFSFLPDLTDAQIVAQIRYALSNGWAVAIEHTDDPRPDNTYWETFGMSMFDAGDPAGVLLEVNTCRQLFTHHFIRVTALQRSRQGMMRRMSFLVHRPQASGAGS